LHLINCRFGSFERMDSWGNNDS